jgi:hypothetical protein
MAESKSRAMRGRTIYVITLDSNFFGAWSSLKQLCIDMNEKVGFASYSKLSKEIATIRKYSIDITQLPVIGKDEKTYTIQIEILK